MGLIPVSSCQGSPSSGAPAEARGSGFPCWRPSQVLTEEHRAETELVRCSWAGAGFPDKPNSTSPSLSSPQRLRNQKVPSRKLKRKSISREREFHLQLHWQGPFQAPWDFLKVTARGICGINRKNSSWERTLLQLQLWT